MTAGDAAWCVPWTDASDEIRRWVCDLLLSEGVDLLRASGDQLARGTPVYVRDDGDIIEVQRLMAHHHIAKVPVLRDGRLLGLVDLAALALGDELAGLAGTAGEPPPRD